MVAQPLNAQGWTVSNKASHLSADHVRCGLHGALQPGPVPIQRHVPDHVLGKGNAVAVLASSGHDLAVIDLDHLRVSQKQIVSHTIAKRIA